MPSISFVLQTLLVLLGILHLSAGCVNYDADGFQCFCSEDGKELECDDASNVPLFYPSNETFVKLEFMADTKIKRFPPKAFQNIAVENIIMKQNKVKLNIHRKAFRSQRKMLESLVLTT